MEVEVEVAALLEEVLVAAEALASAPTQFQRLLGDETDVSNSKRKPKAPSRAHKRRHIRGILEENKLSAETKSAQQQEAERLARLETVKAFEDVSSPEVHLCSSPPHTFVPAITKEETQDEEEIICLSSDEEDTQKTQSQRVDPSPGFIHLRNHVDFTDDSRNGPELCGRLLVNPGHSPDDPDVFIADHLSTVLKPHQLGGVRFLYNNVVENLKLYRETAGLGCILAHSMGLGKTLQVISFLDVLFRSSETQHALVIVPVNTIQNWVQEFEKWVPADVEGLPSNVRPRNFQVFVLNDTCKNIQQRAKQITNWRKSRGALVMGYEMFRLMVTRDFQSIAAQNREKDKRKRKRKKMEGPGGPTEVIDIEEEEIQESLSQEMREALVNPGPDVVICDEGHRIKNLQAETSKTLNGIRTLRRVVLTGYPLQNNLMEYYHMVGFVRPRYLGTRQEFGNMFERPIRNGQCIDSTPQDIKTARMRTHVLINLVKGFVQRRGHDLLKNILYEKKEFVLLMRKSPIQFLLYKQFLNHFHVDSEFDNPLKAFAVCCKIWNHPDILYRFLEKRRRAQGQGDMVDMDMVELGRDTTVDTFRPNTKGGFNQLMTGLSYEWAEGVLGDYQLNRLENGYKMLVTFEILRGALAKGEKTLLFSQSLFTLDLIEEYLARDSSFFAGPLPVMWKKNFNYFRLDGSTSATERSKLVTRFNNEAGAYLFLISTKAGSLGINLTGSSRTIIFDASWNPCHDAQAICRMYRYGQTKPTFVYRLVTDNSMERAIFNRQLGKKGVADRVVDAKEVDANVTEQEMQNLMMFEEAEDLAPPILDTHDWDLEDEVLQRACAIHSYAFSQMPMTHESLILDREKSMTFQEKEEAMKDYQREVREIRFGVRSPQRGTHSSYTSSSSRLGIGLGQSKYGYGTNINFPMSNRLFGKDRFMVQPGSGSQILPDKRMPTLRESSRPVPPPVALVKPIQASIPVPMRLHATHPQSQPFQHSDPLAPSTSNFQYQQPSQSQGLDGMEAMNFGAYGESNQSQQWDQSLSIDGLQDSGSYSGSEYYSQQYPVSQQLLSTDPLLSANIPSSSQAGPPGQQHVGTSVKHIVCSTEIRLPSITSLGQEITIYPGQNATLVRTLQGIYLRLPNGHILDAKGSAFDIPEPQDYLAGASASSDLVDLCDSD